MLAENFTEQGGGRSKADALQGQQQSYVKFNATDINVFGQILVSCISFYQVLSAREKYFIYLVCQP